MQILQNDWKVQFGDNGPSQEEFDAKIGQGVTVKPNNYIFNIIRNLQKIYQVLSQTLETSRMGQIFKETFRLLANEIETFSNKINTDSKYSKIRLRVDLNCLQKNIQSLKFED